MEQVFCHRLHELTPIDLYDCAPFSENPCNLWLTNFGDAADVKNLRYPRYPREIT